MKRRVASIALCVFVAAPGVAAAQEVVVCQPVLVESGVGMMADQYDPYFADAEQVVRFKAGDFYSTPAFYELQGVPEGARLFYGGEDRRAKKFFVQAEGTQLQVWFSGSKANLPQRGVNTEEIPLQVIYPDESVDYIRVNPKLVPEHAYLYQPKYDENISADPGKTVTLEPFNLMQIPLPVDAVWSVEGPAEWKPSIDAKTGALTVTVPTNTRYGATFTVRTKFADGSTQKVSVTVGNTGVGAVIPKEPATEPPAPVSEGEDIPCYLGVEETGSSPLQKVALALGVIAALGGLIAAAMAVWGGALPKLPQLPQLPF